MNYLIQIGPMIFISNGNYLSKMLLILIVIHTLIWVIAHYHHIKDNFSVVIEDYVLSVWVEDRERVPHHRWIGRCKKASMLQGRKISNTL